jgi:hypothetical protein
LVSIGHKGNIRTILPRFKGSCDRWS